MPYYEGQPVPLTFTLSDVNGNPVNAVATPPVVTVSLPTTPVTTATPTVTNTGAGLYSATYVTSVAGHHEIDWVCADATYPGALTDRFDVWPLTDNGILQFSDAKTALSIAQNNTAYDAEIREFNASITAWLEWYCGSVIVQTVVETLRVGGEVVQLSKPPVSSLLAWTSVPSQFVYDTTRVVPVPASPMFPVMVYGVTYPLSQLFADPVKGWVRHTSGLPFYYGPYLWQYQAGYPVIPYAISYAAKTVLRHLFGLERGGGGSVTAVGADEETSETGFGFAVPNRVLETLAPYQLPAAIA